MRKSDGKHLMRAKQQFERAMADSTELFQSLIDDNKQDHPECLGCHTTGYGQPGGYRNVQATDHLTSVQCEVCHRVAVTHLQKPQNTAGTVKKVSEGLCVTCHTPVQSPDFHYEEAIERVRH